MERRVYPGEFYRHFKNKLYQIVAVASHSETGEEMVVYQALYGDFKVYVRPYDMFVSPVDREKYPDVQQQYRFERVELQAGGPGHAGMAIDQKGDAAEDLAENRTAEPNPDLLRFLDAGNFDERMECLKALERTATQSDLDSIYLVLDMKQENGSVKEQVRAIERFLAMQDKYDGSRLR